MLKNKNKNPLDIFGHSQKCCWTKVSGAWRWCGNYLGLSFHLGCLLLWYLLPQTLSGLGDGTFNVAALSLSSCQQRC